VQSGIVKPKKEALVGMFVSGFVIYVQAGY